MAPFMVLALGTGLQVSTPGLGVPTAIEQALIEYKCRITQTAGVPETDAHQACLSAQLLSLRTDFGRDLSRLSRSERRTIDSVCSAIREERGRDAYVECLSGQLVSLRNRGSRAGLDPSAPATLPPPSVSVPSASPASPASLASWWPYLLWIGAALLALGVAAGGIVLAMKARRAPHQCRVCGMDIPDSGDLCQKCRHEAAEALRRAANERADHQRAQEEEQRRQHEHEEEERGQKLRQDEQARLRQEQARQEEHARREEQLRQREEESCQPRQASVTSQEVFDPYAILGVSRDASQEEIRAAYQEAKTKYDVEQVAHLSVEVQEHFKTKGQAVERAYQQIAVVV